MAFREVRVFEVREVLRLWLANEGFRSIERLSQVDDLSAVKIHELLGRRGIEVPVRTVQRYVNQVCGQPAARDRPCGSSTASPATSVRSTSAASGCCST